MVYGPGEDLGLLGGKDSLRMPRFHSGTEENLAAGGGSKSVCQH